MNTYYQKVITEIKTCDLHPEYRSFLVKTITELATEKSEDEFIALIGPIDEFMTRVKRDNEKYCQSHPSSPVEQQVTDETQFGATSPTAHKHDKGEHQQQTIASDLNSDNNGKTLKKSKFYRIYQKTIMLIYKILCLGLVLTILWNTGVILVRYHNYNVSIVILSICFACFAFLALIGLILEQIRNIIYSLVYNRDQLVKYLCLFFLIFIIVVFTCEIIKQSYLTLVYYTNQIINLSDIKLLIGFN